VVNVADLIEIEKSIIKKYRKLIWRPFTKAINDFNLINDNDKIMVCISGGKDSFLMAKCFQEIKKHGRTNFDLKFVVMNPGYSEESLNKIKENAHILNIPILIFDTDIFAVANKLNPDHPCYMCARMRRGHLYNQARELGCNKIALGHHFDDVIETTLLSMFYSSCIQTMLPKLNSDNFPGLELIRPLYYVKEEDIISWSKTNNLTFLNCACSFTKKETVGKRLVVKNIIKNLRNIDKDIDNSIFKSMENINLNCVLGYKKDNEYINIYKRKDENDEEDINNKYRKEI